MKQLLAERAARKAADERNELNSLFAEKAPTEYNKHLFTFIEAVGYGLQALSVALASGVFFYVAKHYPMYKFPVGAVALIVLVALEIGKRKFINTWNVSRIASVASKPALVGSVIFTSISMFLSYTFTAPAVEGVSVMPAMASIEAVQDSVQKELEAALLPLQLESKQLEEQKAPYRKFDKSLGANRYRSSAMATVKNIDKQIAGLSSTMLALRNQYSTALEQEVQRVKDLNKQALEAHINRKGSLSSTLSGAALLADIVLFLITMALYNFKKQRQEELNIILSYTAPVQKEAVKEESVQEDVTEDVQKESIVQEEQQEVQEERRIGFAGPRQGDMQDGKVLIRMLKGKYKDKLKPHTKRDLQRLVNGNEGHRKKELQQLLEKFN